MLMEFTIEHFDTQRKRGAVQMCNLLTTLFCKFVVKRNHKLKFYNV